MLRPHLGDTGDPPYFWNNQLIVLNDDTNGIDAVADGDFIRVPWEPLVDTDLSHLNVFRFSNFDPTPVMIAQGLSASNTYYLDTSNDLVERRWYSYFIHLYDASGNYSESDTVSYALLSKCTLVSPGNGDTVSLVGLKLQWTDASTYASSFRVLLFDADGKYLYHEDIDIAVPVEIYEITVPVTLNVASGDLVRWRVDAFDHDAGHEVLMGSESSERIFYIQ
jgi:hypothetical protein